MASTVVLRCDIYFSVEHVVVDCSSRFGHSQTSVDFLS